jgi:hypothetical protein
VFVDPSRPKKEGKRPAKANTEGDGKPPAKKRVRKPKKAAASPKPTPIASTTAIPPVTELGMAVVAEPEQAVVEPADEGISKEKLVVCHVRELAQAHVHSLRGCRPGLLPSDPH